MPKVKGSGKSTPLQKLMRLVRSDSPSLVALIDGSPAERRQVLADLERKLQQSDRTVISFNGRRHLTERDIWIPLVQQLLLVMQDLSSRDEQVMKSTEQLIANLDGLVNGEVRTSRRMEVMREFDATYPALLLDLVTKPPLVVVVQGLDMASRGSLLRLLEFMAGFLDLPGCLFVVSLSLRSLEADLEDRHGDNLSFTAREFIEDVFPKQVTMPSDEAARETAREAVRETAREPEKPVEAPGPGLATLYALPEQQGKLSAIHNLHPETYKMLEQEPHLLITLERLVRGDTSPELLQQMAASDLLRNSYQDGNLRAILARQPYFDPSPILPPLLQSGSSGVRTLNEGPRFEQSSGLEVQSGSEIAQRRKGLAPTTARKKVTRKKVKKGARKGRKVKNGRRQKDPRQPAKKGVKKAPPPMVGEDRGVTVESLLEPVLAGDFLAARELWTKIPELDQAHLEELIDRYVVATQDNSPRIRATAAAALGSVARAVAWQLGSEVTDTMLILTGDAVKEVRDAAAETLSQLGHGVGSPPPVVAAPAVPVAPMAPAAPVYEPAVAAPVAPQFQAVPVTGGAPQFKAVSAEQKPAPQFKAVGGEAKAPPKFKVAGSEEKAAPKFKAVGGKGKKAPPKFKVAGGREKATPQFKAVGGEEKAAPQFKPIESAGGNAPQFKPIESAGGDAPQFKPIESAGGDAPQFKPIESAGGNAPQFKPIESAGGDAAPQFKPIESAGGDAAPQFKPIENAGSDAAPQFKPVEATPQFKPGKASFKVVE